MIIGITCFLFNDCSSLYKWSGCFLDLQTILKTHGLLCNEGLLPDVRCMFFHHIVNGLCTYSDASGCYQAYGLSLLHISCGVFAVSTKPELTLKKTFFISHTLSYITIPQKKTFCTTSFKSLTIITHT